MQSRGWIWHIVVAGRIEGSPMLDWLNEIVDWTLVFGHLRELSLAYVFAIPIAWDRETHARTAGLRTFPLVSVAACGYMLIGYQVLDSTDAEARVIQGLMTGMGFIGGGAILKYRGRVQGTATAASLWATGAIGLAVASHRFEIAALVSAVTFLTLRYLKPLAGMDADD
jgi:putative Mg2+ transporter-C (MgtC) family protein